MKKIFTTFLSFLFSVVAVFGADGLANSTDVATWSPSTFGQVQLNDYIMDTPFSTSGGYGQIYVTNIATKFAGLRDGGTIWFDATVLPDLFSVYMTNEANGGAAWPSSGTSKDNPIKIRPLGGQIKTVMTASTSTARLWLIADFKDLEINGYEPSFTGMKHPWSGALHNSFGFQWDGGTVLADTPFQIMVDGTSIRSLTIKNCEVAHGFCALRIVPGNTDFTMDQVNFNKLYLHDSLDGEMFYVGQTTGTPYVKFKKLYVKNVIMARAAAESAQWQHMFDDTDRSYQENFVMVSSGSKWISPFQAFQDNADQYVTDEGKVTMRNFIIDGVPNTAISLISSPGGSPTTEPAIIQNFLVNETRDLGTYGGASMQYGVYWEMRDGYFKDASNSYDFIGGTEHNYYISMNGTDKVSCVNLTSDNAKGSLFGSTGTVDDIIGTATDNAMADIEYLVPQFKGRTTTQYKGIYFETFGSSVPNSGTAVPYTTGDIVARWIPGTSYRFYNCKLGHTSSGATHPESDGTHWEIITFDSEGDPSYHVDWDAGDPQTNYPFDDFRQRSNSIWNIKGMGLKSNERNTNYTSFQWMIDDNGDDSGNLELAGETDPNRFEAGSEDVGRYVRCKAYVKLPGGGVSTAWLGSWTLVN